jgi:hypothetical protein
MRSRTIRIMITTRTGMALSISGEPQEYDPYYELHAMHYQLYLPQYPAYTSCCFQGGIMVPGW